MMEYAYGMWLAVALNAGILIFFVLSYLKPKKRWEWRSMGAFSAFVVALFTEMYGFPLTIYLLTSALGSRLPGYAPQAVNSCLREKLFGTRSLRSRVSTS